MKNLLEVYYHLVEYILITEEQESMDHKLLLVKSITLLFRESQIEGSTENSADLVRTVLESIQLPESSIGMNTDVDILKALKETTTEMCNNPVDHEYDIVSLLQRLKLNCGYDDNLYDTIEQGIAPTLEAPVCKRNIINLRKSINNYFKAKQIEDILSKAAYKFKFSRSEIPDINQFISSVIGQLEPLQINGLHKDPAVVNDVDIGDDKAMQSIFKDVKSSTDGGMVMRTGWQRLNKALQGGFRRGEFVMIGALQHKYKTGLTLSLFQQIALFNKPNMLDSNKKPLLLRISFEDDLNLNMQFMYQYLKYNETKEPIDINNVSIEDMSSYVRDTLRINEYHIKMLRVDPSQWTYRNICNKVIELEAQGYEIHLLMVDYLDMIPTTGCTIGPMGTDKQDLIKRIRNFCSPKKICFITPHQFSTEAKQLIRNGIPEDRFVKEVTGRGYTAGSKGLDRELDVELSLHIFKHKKRTYLTLQLGKHRIPTVIGDDYKYMLYEFPLGGMPVPHDINGQDIGYSSLKEVNDSSSENTTEMFNF